MIIFDNIILGIQNSGGISVRWKELIQSVTKNKIIQDSYFVFYDKCDNNLYHNEICDLIPAKRIIPKRIKLLTRILDFKIISNSKFIFHSSYYRVSSNINAINVITFHDCIQEFYGHGIRNFFVIQMKKRTVKKASHIICNSNTTKIDLIKVYKYPEKNISVIYSGVSPNFYKLENINKNKKLLFIGSRASYKRFDFIIELLKYNSTLELIIVGGGNFNANETKLIEPVKKRVEHLLGIDEFKLNEIYNSVHCLMHPSSYEGFGVPVIEAMKACCPVIAFNCSVVREIAKEGILYFNKYDVNIVDKLILDLNVKSSRDKLVNGGLKIAKSFSWDETGLQTIALFESLLNS